MAADYQWPSVRPLPIYSQVQDWDKCLALYTAIEAELSRNFGVEAVLLPSGRASLAAILEFCEISRKHVVYAPKWSSHCVWDVISRVANPTSILQPQVDVVIAVHKWGAQFSAELNSSSLVIEDSVDSVIKASSALFPLGGEFEIFSLPKIIGSYCGGVVLTKNTNFISHIRQLRFSNIKIVTHQSRLKYKKHDQSLSFYESPEALEPLNRGIDLTGLQHVADCLPVYELNSSTIAKRIKKLNEHIGIELIKPDTNRLPCVFPLKLSEFTSSQPELFMRRHFNWSLSLNKDFFEVCWLLPLHFGVEERQFERMLYSLRLKRYF